MDIPTTPPSSGPMLDYTELSSVAEDILDFSGTEGISLTVDRIITSQFGKTLSLGFLTNSPNSLALRYSSLPQPRAFTSLVHPPGLFTSQDEGLQAGSIITTTIGEDLGLEVQVEHSILPSYKIGATWWNGGGLQPRFQLHGYGLYSSPRLGAKVLYISEEHWIGLSWLYSLAGDWWPWTVGAEMLYSLKEKVPGASFGCRRHQRDSLGRLSVWTGTISPISGHLISTYTAGITKRLAMSTRLEFNMYSYESNVTVGVDVCPLESPWRLHTRLGLSEGFGFLLECTLSQLKVAFTTMLSFREPFRQAVGLDISYMP